MAVAAAGGAGTAAAAAAGGAGTATASAAGGAGTATGGAGTATGGALTATAAAAVEGGSAAGSGHGAATAVASSACPEGMDPKSTYLLKFRLIDQKKARKEIKCFCFDKFIDSDLANYKDLVESVVEEYLPRYLEVPHVQYYDDVLKTYPEVKSDQDLLSMFEKFSKTKVVQMFISYCDPSEPYEPITEYFSDVFIQTEINIEQDEDSYLCNPIPENEHVGIDPYVFDKHWVAMEAAKPATTAYIRKWHNRLWSRSQFSTICKVDYVTNNLAECFNNWIKHHKSLNLDDFMDKARQLLMIMWNRRRNVAKKLHGLVLPHIIKKLNAMTRDLNLEVVQSSDEVAEVTALGGSGFRFVVNLQERTCSCRQWQTSGLPCKHALAFITSLSHTHIQNHVDLYYSIEKFGAAYAQLIPAMPDKTQWPESDHGFFMHPPLLKATAGRPKTERYKGCGDKKRKSGKHLCPICKDYGHHWHKCKKGNPEDIAAMMAVREPPKKRKKKTQATESAIVPCVDEAPSRMCFPPSQNLEITTKKGKDVNKSLQVESSSKKRKGGNSGSGGSKRSSPSQKQKGTAKKKKIELANVPTVPLDSPAMGTRSKKFNPSSPAMSTRSRRRLSL